MNKVKIVTKGGTVAGQCFMFEVPDKPDENGSYGYVTHKISSVIPVGRTYLIEKDTNANIDPYFVDFSKPR